MLARPTTRKSPTNHTLQPQKVWSDGGGVVHDTAKWMFTGNTDVKWNTTLPCRCWRVQPLGKSPTNHTLQPQKVWSDGGGVVHDTAKWMFTGNTDVKWNTTLPCRCWRVQPLGKSPTNHTLQPQKVWSDGGGVVHDTAKWMFTGNTDVKWNTTLPCRCWRVQQLGKSPTNHTLQPQKVWSDGGGVVHDTAKWMFTGNTDVKWNTTLPRRCWRVQPLGKSPTNMLASPTTRKITYTPHTPTTEGF
ncbi:hypothetical protein J6590_101536 [Homalodisca vitripennis]|nr:hypothetical protein J6590_101536 [Homalodisca vitripennis]